MPASSASVKPPVFLETSIVIDRLFKGSTRRKEYDAVVKNHGKKLSSVFVKFEMKKGVLQYLVYLHSQASQCSQMSEVHESIKKLHATPRRHMVGTILEQMALYMKQIENTCMQQLGKVTISDFQLKMLQAYLRNLIEGAWLQFDNLIDESINEMDAFLDLSGPTYNSRKKLFDNVISHDYVDANLGKIQAFIVKNENEFKAILDRLEKIKDPDEETKKRVQEMKRILSRLNRTLTRSQCYRCGDALIATESPKDAEVFTNNMKHFEPICEAIGRKAKGY